MLTLAPNECRVLGVLVEKAQTTPAQYPLTLNSLITGSNQKNNRLPVLNLNEDQVLEAVDGLRAKALAREVMMEGSRVAKYRHLARETLEITTSELVVLTEMLLRGPQTAGELRGRASRMHPIESLEVLDNLLNNLMNRPEPMVQRLAPAPGSRAARFGQLLCPDLHPLDAAPAPAAVPMAASAPSGGGGNPALEARVAALEEEVRELREMVKGLTSAAGAAE